MAIIIYFFSVLVGLGYLIGATLSGLTGYVGMLVSVQANVRTAEASRKGLSYGLSVAFKSGAVTGMLVAGLALLSISVYYYILIKIYFFCSRNFFLINDMPVSFLWAYDLSHASCCHPFNRLLVKLRLDFFHSLDVSGSFHIFLSSEVLPQP